MTDLDHRSRRPGYYDASPWPVECGGPRRQKLVGSPGLNLQPGERLASTTRQTGGWPVMFVQRDPGQLYVQGGAGLARGEWPPRYRASGDNAGWLERVDPITLETLARSPALPSGGHLWCGAAVVHENGDLYMVNGRYCHRLDPDCQVVAERELVVDGPYNGLLITSDGHLVMKNLGHRPGQPCQWSVLEPERLEPVGPPLVVDEPCMGRFSSDLTESGEFIYASTATELYRLHYANGTLTLDSAWSACYSLDGEDQADGWDTSIGSGSIWLMDMGRPPMWSEAASAPQRAFRFSLADPADHDVIDVIGHASAFSPGPPLYDPERRILVVYDGTNGGIAALRYEAPGALHRLWQNDYRNNVQMMVYPDTGELIVEDAPIGANPSRRESHAVILDIETGEERGRAGIGARSTSGMFLCPGFERDFYVAALPGEISRVFVQSPQTEGT